MSDLRELYQEMIVDHSRRPRNFGTLANANHIKEGYNPLCGDQLTLFLNEQDGVISQVQFEGTGCAISMASASLMTEMLRGKKVAEADEIFKDFIHLVTHGNDKALKAKLGKLAVLAGVNEFPARVKCATLAWHTLHAAMHDDPNTISTE